MKSQAAIQNNWQQLIIRRAVLRFLRMMRPKERQPICDWVQERVDLKYDATSAAAGKIELYPYQVEPLMATEDPNVQQVTLEWAPRLGKSTIWKMSMLKRLADGGLSGLIVYPTMEMGVKTNKDTVQPLMMTLPEARRDLATRGGNHASKIAVMLEYKKKFSLQNTAVEGTEQLGNVIAYCNLDTQEAALLRELFQG